MEIKFTVNSGHLSTQMNDNNLYQELMATGLFESDHLGARFYINGTLYCKLKLLDTEHCYILFKYQESNDGWHSYPNIVWQNDTLDSPSMKLKFEDLFESLPPLVQERLLFHLDLFR